MRYNQAKAILTLAGSNSAGVSHKKHTHGAGSPEGHGRALIAEARAEFVAADVGLPGLQNGMTVAHNQAIDRAQEKMGL